MLVLHVTPYFAPAFGYGGPPRSILGLCRGLQRAGVDVRVFTTTANGRNDLPASPETGDCYAGVPVRYFRRAWPYRFFGAAGLRVALASEMTRYDLTHIHGLWNVPAWIGARYARRLGVPYVLSPRGMLDAGSMRYRWVRKQLAFWTVEQRNLSGAALVHATSTAELLSIERLGLAAETILVPNGVNIWEGERPEPGCFRRKLGVEDGAKLVVFLGRIHPIKRLDLLADAFALVLQVCSSAHLIIAGPEEGSYREAVEPKFLRLGRAVHWVGELSEVEKWALLTDAELLVLCSDSESFGMCVAEAMAAGVPVVVTRTCPWQDVETFACGHWVDATPAAIAEGILRVLRDVESADSMGRRGQMLVEMRYSWDAIGRRMAESYASVARKRAAFAKEPHE